MGGQTFELLGLLTLAGFAGVFSIVLATAGFEALDHSALVGLLVLGFAVVLLLTTASVGIWGVIEWIRADGTRATPDQDASARDAEGRIRTVRGAMQQRAFIQLVCKVAFFCSSINLGVEMYYLRRCERIFLIVTPPDHHYCDNLAYHPTGIASINPQSRTFFTEMPGTAWAIGFFSTIFSYAEIQRAILGQKATYPCTGARCPPWVDPLDSKLLDEGFLSYWATGNKSPLIRGRMIVRAPVLATQLMFVWTLPPIMLLWIIHMADTQDWDGGMAPGYFIAFKTIWCMGVGMNSVGVGFMSATSDKTFTIIRQRFAERPTTASWSQSRNGRSLAETQYGAVTIGSPNIGAGDL